MDWSNVESGSTTTAPEWKDIEKQLIKNEEEFSSVPYKDIFGFWTIGWGHRDSTINSETPPWSLDYANKVFDEDFDDALMGARHVCASFDTLNGCRKGVIVQMVFQMGENGVKKFVNTLRFIDEDDFESAAIGMKTSFWAKQTPFRARRLAERMRTGIYD